MLPLHITLCVPRMPVGLKEFCDAAVESIRFDWVIISANMIGICVVLGAAAYARAEPVLQQSTSLAASF